MKLKITALVEKIIDIPEDLEDKLKEKFSEKNIDIMDVVYWLISEQGLDIYQYKPDEITDYTII
jgi:hypothetical protein